MCKNCFCGGVLDSATYKYLEYLEISIFILKTNC